MENAQFEALVVKALAKLLKVLHSLWHQVLPQLKHHPPDVFAVRGDLKEALGVVHHQEAAGLREGRPGVAVGLGVVVFDQTCRGIPCMSHLRTKTEREIAV